MVRRDAGAVRSLLLAVAAARKSWGATPHRARSTSTSSGRWRRRRARCATRSGNLSLARLLPAGGAVPAAAGGDERLFAAGSAAATLLWLLAACVAMLQGVEGIGASGGPL